MTAIQEETVVPITRGRRRSAPPPGTVELWHHYWNKRDTLSRNALVLTYHLLVRRAVRNLPAAIRAGADDDDLYSFGLFGLIDAIEKCEVGTDPRRFAGYASYRIRGAIIDELRRLDWMPRTTRRHLVAYRAATDELSGTLGRAPRHTEVCESLEFDDSTSSVVLLAVAESRVVSLTVVSDDDPGTTRGRERVVAEDEDGPEESIVSAESRADLDAAIAKLSSRQRQVINHRFVGGLTQHQIAALLGVSTARVCQLESAAIRALRKSVGASRLEAAW